MAQNNQKNILGVPTNSLLGVGTVPTNSLLEVGTVPTNSLLEVGTVPTNSLILILKSYCAKLQKMLKFHKQKSNTEII